MKEKTPLMELFDVGLAGATEALAKRQTGLKEQLSVLREEEKAYPPERALVVVTMVDEDLSLDLLKDMDDRFAECKREYSMLQEVNTEVGRQLSKRIRLVTQVKKIDLQKSIADNHVTQLRRKRVNSDPQEVKRGINGLLDTLETLGESLIQDLQKSGFKASPIKEYLDKQLKDTRESYADILTDKVNLRVADTYAPMAGDAA